MPHGKINAYVCLRCGHLLLTIDRHEGDVLDRVHCRRFLKCRGTAQSLYYRVDQRLVATHEWRIPTAAESEDLTLTGVEWVESGGLILRARDPAAVEADLKRVETGRAGKETI